MQTATTKESIVKKMGLNSKSADTVHEKSAAIARDFRNFVTDVEDLVKATAQLTGEDLARARVKINERIAVAKQSLSEVGENLTERASKAATSANNYVHEKPWPVIGAGAALGFLAGYLLTHRSSDE